VTAESLDATKECLVERQRRCTPFATPREDRGVGVAEASPRSPEDPPDTVQKGPRRRRDLQSFLGSHPGARRLRCSESHAVVDEGHRFRINLAWNEDGIGRRGGPASLVVERIGLREESVEEAGVCDLHRLTRRDNDRDAGWPACLRPRTSEGTSSPTDPARETGWGRLARRLPRTRRRTRGLV